MLTWLPGSRILNNVPLTVEEPHDCHINKTLALAPGDVVFLARRPRVPRVCVHNDQPYFTYEQ